ncbi:MAG TPA: hypothetical protein VGH07_05560, partial [Chthoniobacterales bacterium]
SMVPGCRGGGSLVKCPVRKTDLVLELLVNFLLPWVCYRMAFPYLAESTTALPESEIIAVAWGFLETGGGINATISCSVPEIK